MPAQTRPVARRTTTARAGNAVARIEESVALEASPSALGTFWEESTSDGREAIDEAINAYALAVANAVRARTAAAINEAFLDVADQVQEIAPPAVAE